MPRAATLRSLARPPWWILFAMAGGGLVLSAYGAVTGAVPAFCSSVASSQISALGEADVLLLAVALNPPGRIMGGWAAMLLAMMPPLLAAPLMHVWRSSLPRRRAASVTLFLLGYGMVWMAVGPLLITLAIALQVAGRGSLWVFGATILVALLWSACPGQRAALNRSHRLPRIGLFGWTALRDCVRFGVIHALWCVASCWPWMLAAAVAENSHLAFMVAAGAIMFGERLAPPEPPRWRWPVLILALDPRPALAPLRGLLRHG
ncbi:DUF2182 domain-containing protein [Bradyrhizobium sp. HKCCYLS20291]|uniref:copper chaperone n=1 Tax=Bradyrhizobium sp. HKCCYLS20291 TaxID=3420766 RepID=UPI003EBBB90B